MGRAIRRFPRIQRRQTNRALGLCGIAPGEVTNFYGSYGYGHYPYGHRGRYGYSGLGFGMGPEIAYIPYRIASVWFVNSRVDSWERAR